MSSSSRTLLAYIKETVFGQTPATPVMQKVPYNTGDAINNARDTITSAQLQSQRAPRQTRMGTNQPTKSIGAEFTWGNFDELLAGGFGSPWTGGMDITFTGTATTGAVFTVTGGEDLVELGITPGMIVVFEDGQILKVDTVGVSTVTLIQLDDGAATISLITPAEPITFICGSIGLEIDSSGNTLDFNATANTLVRTTGSWITDGFKAGDNFYIDATTSGNNDGWTKIVSVTALTLTLEAVDTTETESTATVAFATDAGSVNNGNNLSSYTFEEAFLDHNAANGYRTMSGVKVASIAFSFQPSAMVALTIELMGAAITDFTTQVASSFTEYSDVEAFDTFTGGFGLDGDSSMADCISAFDITLNNATQRSFCLFERDASRIVDGTPEMTGNVNAFFDDNVLASKFFAEEDFIPSLRMLDLDGNAYVLDITRAKFTGDTISMGDIDVTETLPFAVQPATAPAAELYLRRQPASRV